MISIKDAENFGMGHSANNIFHGLHRKMFTHDNAIAITGIQAYPYFFYSFSLPQQDSGPRQWVPHIF